MLRRWLNNEQEGIRIGWSARMRSSPDTFACGAEGLVA